ncbi:MAG: alpha/beta hydrolase family protein [Devosia sp.]
MTQSNRIDTLLPDAPELAARGPHAVGVRTLTVTSTARRDVLNGAGHAAPLYDRPLVLEIWYPADLQGALPGTSYADVPLVDGVTRITLHGQAVRDAAPLRNRPPAPLVLVSHGYPGNRFLLSHFGEHLASRGYVVVAIDHFESTYDNKLGFASTLMHRAPDQLFVLDAIAVRSADPTSFLHGLVDANHSAIIGYSMGGYGALISAGAGVTQASTKLDMAPAGDSLASLQADTVAYDAQRDPRLKAIIAIGPWGYNAGFWDAQGLAGITIPSLFIAGSLDQVSGYDPGVRSLYQAAINAERYLLTFDNAGHNAAAPIPAPLESLTGRVPGSPYGHYADAVWSTQRMNNIAQHFVTAFLDTHLRGDQANSHYLDLPAAGGLLEEPDWPGFAPNTARGLRLEHAVPASK